jgi:hypothetical protein
MNVKKIFILLITIVACVMVGALILNVLMPNVTGAMVNSVEHMVFSATGMNFDFNGDGVNGKAKQNTAKKNKVAGAKEGANGASVDGFEKGKN